MTGEPRFIAWGIGKPESGHNCSKLLFLSGMCRSSYSHDPSGRQSFLDNPHIDVFDEKSWKFGYHMQQCMVQREMTSNHGAISFPLSEIREPTGRTVQ
jgi:hypothetical protein